jgi:hypothetical protein
MCWPDRHDRLNRVNQWRPWVKARRFGIVALGYSRLGELESQLVERLDQIALREVRRPHSRADIRSGDVFITVKGATASGSSAMSRFVLKSHANAFTEPLAELRRIEAERMRRSY